MRILFINNDGGGFADTIDVAEGVTVDRLFADRMGDASPDNYFIRVNRQHASGSQILSEGDRVSITPTKIHGATLVH